MHSGIERSVIGDLIVQKEDLYIFCKEKISKYIIDNCKQIGKCTVHFEECLDYIITENNKKEIHIMCSSLRLDSVVAQLSHCSRSEALKKDSCRICEVNDVVLEQIYNCAIMISCQSERQVDSSLKKWFLPQKREDLF